MNSQGTHNNNNNNTNQAWDKLHSRLNAEGLIPDGSNHKTTNIHRVKNTRFIYALSGAAVIILIISSLFLLNPTIFRDKGIIKLSNKEEQAISVTTLKDGSTIYLASRASISYSTNFSESNRKIVLQGNAYFEIKSNENSPFIVEAPTFTIKVLGTSFIVNYDGLGNPQISVEHGKVSLKLKKTGEEKILYSGEATAILKETFADNAPLTSQSFFAKTNKLHFKDQLLKDVVRVLNQKYPNSTIMLSSETEQRMITATFSGESPNSIAQMICIALKLNHKVEKGIITIYE